MLKNTVHARTNCKTFYFSIECTEQILMTFFFAKMNNENSCRKEKLEKKREKMVGSADIAYQMDVEMNCDPIKVVSLLKLFDILFSGDGFL